MNTAITEMTDVKQLLTAAVQAGASDLHINVGMAPVLRINTELVLMKHEPISTKLVTDMLMNMIGSERFEIFEKKRDYDFSATIEDGSRFRVNAHYQKDTIALSFRPIPRQIPDINEINLPKMVGGLAVMPRGLVVVTGHTGSGKSTTLAAMIGLINNTSRKRIITLEMLCLPRLSGSCAITPQRWHDGWCEATLPLPPLPAPPSTAGAGKGVWLCACGLERRPGQEP